MSSHVIRRLDSELNHPLNVAYVKNTVGYLQSSNAPFGVNQNELIFTRPCELLICFNAAWGVWSGSGTYDGLLPPEISSGGGENPGVPEPVWRFSATGTNRTVTVQPAFKISGSLSTGPGEMKLIPSTLTFQEHDIYPGNIVPANMYLAFGSVARQRCIRSCGKASTYRRSHSLRCSFWTTDGCLRVVQNNHHEQRRRKQLRGCD